VARDRCNAGVSQWWLRPALRRRRSLLQLALAEESRGSCPTQPTKWAAPSGLQDLL